MGAGKSIAVLVIVLLVQGTAAAGSVWERVKTAGVKATVAPETWIPLLCAGIFYATGLDTTVSDWASEQTPVFGSQENARRWSDYLAGGTAGAQFAASVAAVPTDPAGNAAYTKLGHVVTGVAANELTFAAVGGLKGLTRRERPDRSGDNSFPSGHSSSASVNVTLTLYLLPVLPVPESSRPYVRGALITLLAGTSWARIEGKKHYPSDVLAGAAIGHWIGSFMSVALWNDCSSAVFADPLRQRYLLQVSFLFGGCISKRNLIQ
jgi:membrane-associated phospholipid phosphatase